MFVLESPSRQPGHLLQRSVGFASPPRGGFALLVDLGVYTLRSGEPKRWSPHAHDDTHPATLLTDPTGPRVAGRGSTNFLEPPQAELRRRCLPRTRVNRDIKGGPERSASDPPQNYCSSANGLPSSSESAPKMNSAGSVQGMSCAPSVLGVVPVGQLPTSMSLLTSTIAVACSSAL